MIRCSHSVMDKDFRLLGNHALHVWRQQTPPKRIYYRPTLKMDVPSSTETLVNKRKSFSRACHKGTGGRQRITPLTLKHHYMWRRVVHFTLRPL